MNLLLMMMMNPSLGLHHAQINSSGFFLEPLGDAKILSHYHGFLFHLNLTNILKSFKVLYENSLEYHDTFPHESPGPNHDTISESYLSMLRSNVLECKQILGKFSDSKLGKSSDSKKKRGLINGVGKLIKFIAGNPDNDDLELIMGNIDRLHRTQSGTIEKINQLTCFANHITKRLSVQADVLNGNINRMEIFLNLLQKKTETRALLQYEVHQSEKFLEFLKQIERTVSVSLADIPNLEMIKVDELKEIHQYLTNVYSPLQLFTFDEHHLFKMLEGTKISIIGTNQAITFLLKLPILYPDSYQYLRVYPIPTVDNVIIVPPHKYQLQASDNELWTSEKCRRTSNVTLCTHPPVQEQCTLAKLSCPAVTVNNDYKLVQVLSNYQVLTSFKLSEEILEDCSGIITRHKLSGTNIIDSPCRLIIGTHVIAKSTPSYQIHVPEYKPLALNSSLQVQLNLKYLESPTEILQAASLLNPPLPETSAIQIIHSAVIMAIMASLTVLIILYRQRIKELFCYPRQIVTLNQDVTLNEDVQT